MKNGMLKKARCLALAVLMAGEIMSGGAGMAYAAYEKEVTVKDTAEYSEDDKEEQPEERSEEHAEDYAEEHAGIFMEQEAHWTDEENFRALVTVRIRGLRAYLSEREHIESGEMDSGEEDPEERSEGENSPEERSEGENSPEEKAPEEESTGEGSEGETGPEEESAGEKSPEEGDTGENSPEEENKREAGPGEKKTEGEDAEEKVRKEETCGEEVRKEAAREEEVWEEQSRKEESREEVSCKETAREEEVREDDSPEEKGSEEYSRGSRENTPGGSEAEGQEQFREEAKSGQGDVQTSASGNVHEENEDVLSGMDQERVQEDIWEPQIGTPPILPEGTVLPPVEYEVVPVASFIQFARNEETVQEGTVREPDSLQENKIQKIFLINIISPFFAVDAEMLGTDMTVEEISAAGRDGEAVTLTRVTSSVDVRDVGEKEEIVTGTPAPGEEPALREDEYVVEIPVILKEFWRIREEDRSYPVSYFEIPEMPEVKSGVCLVSVQDGEEEILAEAASGFLQVDGAECGFQLELSDGGNVPKAGRSSRYQVTLKNTGTVPLKEIRLESIFSVSGIAGFWEKAEGLTAGASGRAILNELKKGESRELFVHMELPESFQGELVHTVRAAAVNPADPQKQIRREAAAGAEVAPLKVEYSVKKTADRTQAYPGDTIIYQICIRNTGERTLHSVLSTERFLKKNISARFLEQEGVILSEDKTQALIPQIPPGEVYSMDASVTLPEDLESGELINQVIVTARETGDRAVQAESGVSVEPAQGTETPAPTELPAVTEASADPGEPEFFAEPMTSNPKTGDSSGIEFWMGIMGAALFAGILIAVLRHCLSRKKRNG